ncbi:MAG: YfhO family protein [Limisphaerales bacterium]
MTTDPQPDEPNTLETICDWFTPRRFASLLALLVAASFVDVLFGSSAFVTKDFSQFGYGLAHHHRESFWNGEIPLWNPLSECGIPFLAQWNTLVLYPGSLLYLLFPLDWSLSAFSILHLYFGGLGAYFLARRHTGNDLAGAIAGFIFACNGFMQACLMWPNNIAALGWMPWVFLTVIPAWRDGGRKLLIAALVGALQMLTGAPEVILCTWVMVTAYLVWDWFQSGAAVKKDKLPFLRFAGLVGFITLLTAAQMLPFLDLLQHSERQAHEEIVDWPTSRLAWVRFMMPLFHTRMSSLGLLDHLDQGWIHSYYVGGTTVVLGCIALGASRRKSVRWMGAMILFAITLAMGDNFFVYPLLSKFLPLGFVRYPVKFLTFAIALFPLLAAFGLREILSAKDEEARRRITIGAMIGGALVLTAYFLIGSQPDGHTDLEATRGDGHARLFHLALIAGSVVTLWRVSSLRVARLAAVVFIFTLWADLTAMPKRTLAVSREIYSLPLPAMSTVNDEFKRGETRFALLGETQLRNAFNHGRQAEQVQVDAWLAQFMNLNLLGGVKKFDGFFALWFPKQRQVQHILHSWKPNDLRPGLADFLAIAYTPAAGHPEQWVHRPSAHKIISAGQQPVFENDDNRTNRLTQFDFDPSAVVSLPPAAQSEQTARTSVDVKVEILQIDAHEIVFSVDAPTNTTAVIAQSHYHPWRAFVDERQTPIHRANHAFQAIDVPAGQHRITLRYVDRAFRIGVVLSLFGMVLLGLLWRKWSPQSARSDEPQ